MCHLFLEPQIQAFRGARVSNSLDWGICITLPGAVTIRRATGQEKDFVVVGMVE